MKAVLKVCVYILENYAPMIFKTNSLEIHLINLACFMLNARHIFKNFVKHLRNALIIIVLYYFVVVLLNFWYILNICLLIVFFYI